jgi:hypothetical protein
MFVVQLTTFIHTQNKHKMKKLFLSMSIVAASMLAMATPPKTTGNNVNTYAANESLKKIYGKVGEVSWRKAGDNMLRADFVIDGEKHSAFFEADGGHVATTVETTLDKLPAPARIAVTAKTKGKEMSALVHYTSETESSYFFEINDGKKKSIFKVTQTGSVSRFN